MSQHLYALTHGLSGIILVYATVLIPICVAVGYAAGRLTAARERRPAPRSAFATPPSSPVRSATRSHPEASQKPPRKRTRKWRAQMANSMAAHASASRLDNHQNPT